jgi:hypothetical protein
MAGSFRCVASESISRSIRAGIWCVMMSDAMWRATTHLQAPEFPFKSRISLLIVREGEKTSYLICRGGT